MIPVEIVHTIVTLGFVFLWLNARAERKAEEHRADRSEEKARELELENANLSGTITAFQMGTASPRPEGKK